MTVDLQLMQHCQVRSIKITFERAVFAMQGKMLDLHNLKSTKERNLNKNLGRGQSYWILLGQAVAY